MFKLKRVIIDSKAEIRDYYIVHKIEKTLLQL